MLKWLTSLFLLFALGNGAFSGLPFQNDNQTHSTAGMMDCCEKAHARHETPEIAAAKLCCALNCTEPGSTVPINQSQPIPPSTVIALRVALIRSWLLDSSSLSTRTDKTLSAQRLKTQPAYIFNLALLI